MATRARHLLFLLLAGSLAACSLPGASAPTPFTFPTPNLTHTAIFAATPTDTPLPPTLPPLDPTATPLLATVSAEPEAEGTPLASATASTSEGTTRPNGTPVTAAYLTAPPVIDGDLSEWTSTAYTANQTAPYAGDNWTGTADLSATFYIGWDTQYLYLGVSRTDDQFAQISYGRYMYRGDDVEIQLDVDLDGDFASTLVSSDDFQLGFSPGNFGSLEPEAYRWYPRSLESYLTSVTVAAVQTSAGYDLEARIPWSVVGIAPAEGTHYGFALALSDNDQAGVSTWQSMVTNVSTRRVADPTTWGTLILGDADGK